MTLWKQPYVCQHASGVPLGVIIVHVWASRSYGLLFLELLQRGPWATDVWTIPDTKLASAALNAMWPPGTAGTVAAACPTACRM